MTEKRCEIECYFCQAVVGSVEEACAAGWVPSFYSNQDEVAWPACGKCCDKYLTIGVDGELEEKAEQCKP